MDAPRTSNAPLEIETIDGSVVTFPYLLKVSNGTLTDNGDGTATLTIGTLTTRIVAGSQTISAGRILTEDGLGLLNEDGGNILQNSAPSAPAVNIDILNEDGGKLLNQDGTNVLNEASTSLVTTPGAATPLMYVSTSCQYVILAAKSTNSGTIWVSGSDVAVGLGIPLYVGEDNVQIPIDDVMKVYIIGNVGDGVTFIYGATNTSGQIIDDSGNLIIDDGGNPVISG